MHYKKKTINLPSKDYEEYGKLHFPWKKKLRKNVYI
jgi:hypothetical protein